ncbi:39S ribosomal protein L42, mitochondrial [Uranotaenia lowii]|uniref:39S ribosomal protein L42, mitochondrial n=1 Tax=Uranotaenia lowii TaxID=190385 RepID=UPI00247993BA|nr:39S ribosomal protein L42, mitochondrial [Uranotaenia lowii]
MQSCVKIFRRWNHFKTLKKFENVQVAQGNPQSLVQQISPAVGGKVFVAWHPEPEFPYEFSKPIEIPRPESSSSMVRDELIVQGACSLKLKNPEFVRQELSRVTFTTKHRWFDRARDKKAKKTSMDREYL